MLKSRRIGKASTRAGFLLPVLLLGGCARDGSFAPVDMWNRSRLKPYEPVAYFENGNSSRPLVAGTVARNQLRAEWFGNGTEGGKYLTALPTEMRRYPMRQVLDRGRERYNIYCQPCHGLSGYGDGMIVKRGFSAPPSYHLPRLREAPLGHFYDVISNGYGAMYSYAGRIPVEDRWAISQYIRVLQASQNATLADVPAKLRGDLQKQGRAGTAKEDAYIYPEKAGTATGYQPSNEQRAVNTMPREQNERGATQPGSAPMNPNTGKGANRIDTPSAIPSSAAPSSSGSGASTRAPGASPTTSVPAPRTAPAGVAATN